MSFSAEEMNLMGSTNNYWGVCGFTSTFYAMYENRPAKRPLILGAGIPTRVLAEIKTFLMTLKAEGKTGLLREIEQFTQSFGKVGKCDFSLWTVDAYIQHINTIGQKTDKQITGDCSYSIAMPPDAVAEYVTSMWGDAAQVQVVNGGSGGNEDGIIGVAKTNGTMVMYDGLCHYMYRFNGRIYSWGDRFSSVTAANPDYKVVRLIKITHQ